MKGLMIVRKLRRSSSGETSFAQIREVNVVYRLIESEMFKQEDITWYYPNQ